MALPKEYEPFIYGSGLIGSHPGDTGNHNPLRTTCEAYIITRPDSTNFTAWNDHVYAWKMALSSCVDHTKPSGAFLKYPTSTHEKVTIDDLVPLIHASYLFDKQLYRDVCNYYLHTPLIRHIAILPMMHDSGHGLRKFILNIFLPVSWLSAALTGIFDKMGQDGHILSWHIEMLLFSQQSKFSCTKIREKRMRRYYPGGYLQLLSKYYDCEHPNAIFWPECVSDG